MSVHPRVVHKRRATITALPLYYSGHVLKKHTKEKDFKNYYAELRGATLFLYKDDTQDTYVEKLDLEQLKSMELESPYQRKTPTIFTLTLHTEEVQEVQEVQLKMDNADTGEEWRAYILTVVKRQIPSKLQLLPGQMFLLQDVLVQERTRNPPSSQPPLPPRPSFLKPSGSAGASSPPKATSAHGIPACFFDVTRQEAERMLEANPEYGGIILRPSTLPNNYALTLRQLTPSGPVMKNYRVASTSGGFIIELEAAVMVPSLNDVLTYFIEKTEYRVHPYVPFQPYDTRIDVLPAPECVATTSPTAKIIPKAQVAPMVQSQNKEEPLPDPAKPVGGEYVLPDEDGPDEHDLKMVQLAGDLQEVLKLRRENICKEKGNPPGMAQWATNGAPL
ncbi:signal-transducing adaptor protein 1-like [Parambassis ranga]|uniref:Signal-transducing adaptor protein 1-like n=1 Tax=Parambassis ranga TaxID=210632 RepID=A0A6P7J7U4_9TELE|nr:signal-transducing adaptor protein 1-like [Parambassis ranga]